MKLEEENEKLEEEKEKLLQLLADDNKVAADYASEATVQGNEATVQNRPVKPKKHTTKITISDTNEDGISNNIRGSMHKKTTLW